MDIHCEMSWLAGLFEGEGHIGCKKIGKYYALRVAVAMVDEEPVRMFHKHWGGSLVGRNYEYTGRPQLRWECCSKKAAAFVRDIQPYLRTERVRRKAALALEMDAQKLRGSFAAKSDGDYAAKQLWYFQEFSRLNAVGGRALAIAAEAA